MLGWRSSLSKDNASEYPRRVPTLRINSQTLNCQWISVSANRNKDFAYPISCFQQRVCKLLVRALVPSWREGLLTDENLQRRWHQLPTKKNIQHWLFKANSTHRRHRCFFGVDKPHLTEANVKKLAPDPSKMRYGLHILVHANNAYHVLIPYVLTIFSRCCRCCFSRLRAVSISEKG